MIKHPCLGQIFLVLIWFFPVSMCQAQSPDPFKTQADYLFYLAALTRWPIPAPITICLRGDSPVNQYVMQQTNRIVNGSLIKVLDNELDPLRPCRVMFISGTKSLTSSLLKQAQTEHVLLVGDDSDFASTGGMVQFVLENQKTKLKVNLQALQQAKLSMSSKVLRMAEILP